MYMTPCMSFWFMKVDTKKGTNPDQTGGGDPYSGKFYRIYRGLLTMVLRWRHIAILTGAGLLVIGFLVGVLPGAGGTIASFLAYSSEERIAGPSGRFGQGDTRGVAAPESANNAAANGALIPLLTLGVPGSGTTAVLLGALLISSGAWRHRCTSATPSSC